MGEFITMGNYSSGVVSTVGSAMQTNHTRQIPQHRSHPETDEAYHSYIDRNARSDSHGSKEDFLA